MVNWEVARHQAAIAGSVTDAQTGQAIGGTQVKITAAPQVFTDWLALQAMQYGDRWSSMSERPDQTRTAPDGHFHFLDLPDGSYTLTAALPGAGSRYSTAQVAVVISRDSQGHINLVSTSLALPPTTLKGLVTGKGATSVAMAEVRVKGSGERAFTDSDGKYVLAGLEVGKRTVSVSAQGYQPASQTVTLSAAGVEQSLSFSLVPS